MKIVYASVDCPKDNKSETHDQELMNAYDMLAAFFVQVKIMFIPAENLALGPILTKFWEPV